jgi:hypothetical protein
LLGPAPCHPPTRPDRPVTPRSVRPAGGRAGTRPRGEEKSELRSTSRPVAVRSGPGDAGGPARAGGRPATGRAPLGILTMRHAT